MIVVNKYPFLLGEFKQLKQAIVENNYQLEYGKNEISDGEFQSFARLKSRTYPFDVVSSGEFTNIPVYRVGGEPSATWQISVNSDSGVQHKNIYLFLSNTTSYLHDQKTLPQDILDSFDSSSIALVADDLKNKDTIFDILSESGAIFDPLRSYRQFAIVRSSKDGNLYQKITETESEAGAGQLDPFDDNTNILANKNWRQLFKEQELDVSNYVDRSSKQIIDGQKEFSVTPIKTTISPKPNSKDLVCYAEIENEFLKSNGTAVNALKLGETEASDKGGGGAEGSAVRKAVIVKTTAQGYIDDSFLNFDIVSNESGLTLKVSQTDIADNKKVFNTIQDAFDAAAKLIKLCPVTIKVEDGTYIKNGSAPVLNLTSIYDCSMISIIGNITQPDRCIIQFTSSQQGIFFTGKGLYIDGFKFHQSETDKANSVGINLSCGASMITGPKIIIENAKYGIHCSGNSYLESNNLSISGCDISVFSDASVVDVDGGTSIAANTACIAENNAVIYANGFKAYKGSNINPNTIGFIANYNSTIRAENTSVDAGGPDKLYNDEVTSVPNRTNGIIVY